MDVVLESGAVGVAFLRIPMLSVVTPVLRTSVDRRILLDFFFFLIWRTTPTVMLQKEAVMLLIYYTLDYLCKLAVLCLHKLKVQYPLHV